jgi:CPA2 family monovalent cation:H+ antiporter-2
VPHGSPLITTVVAGLCLAFVFGLVAQRLRLPVIAGYLLAGVLIGPFTPGYVADLSLAAELAEIGVILLMFGVGLHFSLKDLMEVRRIAVPGAIGQIAVATGTGTLFGWALGWGAGAGFLFGLSLSVASTVVLLRAIEDREQTTTQRGRIAVGWLMVEDLAMIAALVLIPAFAGVLGGTEQSGETGEAVNAARSLGLGEVAATLLVTTLKLSAFVLLMLVVGRKLIPAVLHYVVHTGSRELFRLAVLATALGVAWASSTVFGVSFALGSFVAGMVMAGSTLSTRAAMETLPLRDAIAVLFFVSVGMLFDPRVIVEAPLALLGTVLIILVVKSAAAYAIVRAFGRSREVALTIAVALAQVGEVSFLLVTMGRDFAIMPDVAGDLVVAGALISILLNTPAFALLDRWIARENARAAAPETAGESEETEV